MRLQHKVTSITSNGCLSKAWYVNNKGLRVLVKGNTLGAVEPFCEVIAYHVGKLLGLPVIEYKLLPAEKFPEVKTEGNYKWVSVCREFEIPNGYQRLSLSKLFLAMGYSETDPLVAVDNLGIDKLYLYKLLAFDAFIGNTDRHFNNIEFFVSNDGDTIPTPIFDNGGSLLYNKDDSYLNKVVLGTKIYADDSKPFRETHTKQFHLIKRYFNYKPLLSVDKLDTFYSNLFNELAPVFSVMPENRVLATKNYLLNRCNYLL